MIWGTLRCESAPDFCDIRSSADRSANTSAIAIAKKPGRPHLTRWYTHVETLPVPKGALDSYNKAKIDHDKGKKRKRTETVEVVLPNAVKGKVVVRFGQLLALGVYYRYALVILRTNTVQRLSRLVTCTLVTSRRPF